MEKNLYLLTRGNNKTFNVIGGTSAVLGVTRPHDLVSVLNYFCTVFGRNRGNHRRKHFEQL